MSRARDIADTGDNNLDDIVVDGSGNVGIGTDSPSELIHGNGSAVSALLLTTDTYGTGTLFKVQGDGSTLIYNRENSFLRFGTNNLERMRVDSLGDVQIGKTDGSQNTQGIILNSYGTIRANSQSAEALHLIRSTDGNIVRFYNNNTTLVGNINVTASATAYNTSSDYRLKENVTADWDATTRLKQLNPVRFNFIADADTTVDGFLAHEVQDIVPEAITGTKDAMRDEEYEVTPAVLDDDGNEVTPAVMGTRSVPDYQGIDQSKLVPLLVKTIQELEARIAALENA